MSLVLIFAFFFNDYLKVFYVPPRETFLPRGPTTSGSTTKLAKIFIWTFIKYPNDPLIGWAVFKCGAKSEIFDLILVALILPYLKVL